MILVNYLLMAKKSISLKQIIKISTFRLNFVWEAYVKLEEVFLKENLFEFSVDYNTDDKSDILNIHKYL